MQTDNKSTLKHESSSFRDTTGIVSQNAAKFSLNSLNNRLSMKFSSVATSSTSSTSTIGSQSLKLKKNPHAAFQFLRSKPPIVPQSESHTAKPSLGGEVFSDANQVLAIDETDQNLKSNINNLKHIDITKSTTRLSYPFVGSSQESTQSQTNNATTTTTTTTTNAATTATTTTNNNAETETISSHFSAKSSAKRLLFNFISGNSHNADSFSKHHNQHLFKAQNNQPASQRRLSDYHRPIKVSSFCSFGLSRLFIFSNDYHFY